MYSELIISGHEVQWHKKIPVKCPNQYRAYGFFKDDAAQAVVDAIKARRREVHAACCVCEIPRYFTRSKSRPRCGPHMSYLSHGTCEIDMADFDMAHMKSDEAPRTWGRDWNLWMLFFKAHIEIEILSMNNRKIIFHNSLFLLGWVSIRPHSTIYQYLPHSTGLAIPLNIPLPIGHQGLMIPAICGK